MKKVGLFFCLSLCLSLLVTPVSASAEDNNLSPAVEAIQIPSNVPSDFLIKTDGNAVIMGTEVPTTSWDLGANDYTIQFVFDSAIYSNVNFSNHGGEFYLDITTTSTVDQALTVELIEKGKTTPATSALIDTNGSWNVRFYNLNTSKEYYLKFIKIHDGVDVTGLGTVHVN